MGNRVVVCDLDHSLLKTDLLHESIGFHLRRSAVSAITRVYEGRLSRQKFKSVFARGYVPDFASLPYNQQVLNYLESCQSNGDRLVLASASDHRLVTGVAEHLGIFDEWYGSKDGVNLKGDEKRDLITQRYSDSQLCYIGDSTADLSIWGSVDEIVLVHPSKRLQSKAELLSKHISVIRRQTSKMLNVIKLMRPHQWLKNVLVFVPVLAAHANDITQIGSAILAFLSLSLVASGGYCINDLLDVESDRAHPRKKYRPIASGDVSMALAGAIAGLLITCGITLSVFLNNSVTALIVLYSALSICYSAYIKKFLIIDISVLACLYTLRIVTGGVATEIELSVWLIGFSIFFFFSLASLKRLAEVVGKSDGHNTSIPGRAYRAEDTNVVVSATLSAAYASVTILLLYLNSDAVVMLYSSPQYLWGIVLILIYWMTRLVILTARGRMTDDPIVFAVTDRVSLGLGVLVFTLAFLAI